jgi:hypothetical protein
MSKPTTEVIHQGRLVIGRGGEKFGTLWVEKQNIQWRRRRGKRYPSRTWKEFDEFMRRSGRFENT